MAAQRTVRLRLRFADPSRGEWCGGCGRRRTADGRCPRCDAWWLSPLISVGFPLIFATAVLLAIGIRALRGSERLDAPSPAETRALSFTTFAPMTAPPRSQSSAATAPLPPFSFSEEPQERGASEKPRPRPISMAEQVRLRRLSDHVHAVVAADDARRDQAKEEARRGPSSVEVHDAPFTPPATARNGSASGGSLPLPSQRRAPGADPSGPAGGFFDLFAPGSAAARPPSAPAGNYAPGVPVPANSEVR